MQKPGAFTPGFFSDALPLIEKRYRPKDIDNGLYLFWRKQKARRFHVGLFYGNKKTAN
jgi:hypothetical protein